MKTDFQVLNELADRQRYLKRKRYYFSIQIQGLYNRWERNGIRPEDKNGALYIPYRAVEGLTSLVSKLGKIERELQTNRRVIRILEQMRKSK